MGSASRSSNGKSAAPHREGAAANSGAWQLAAERRERIWKAGGFLDLDIAKLSPFAALATEESFMEVEQRVIHLRPK